MQTFTLLALLLSASVVLVHGSYLPLPACQVHGKTYVDGERWEPDLCTFCVCYNGGTLCGGHMCDSTNHCPDAFVPEGECCAVCPSSGERHGPKGQSGQMVPAMAILPRPWNGIPSP
ncbi:collagen alpha-1(I) chain-like [Engraulis encrasicolus]|uniref:collagen alpha-1(I) chain-like n=1 Tax=Engraulis encrasicolus TaxID=184585 RepID=UPI002FD1F4DB